MKPINWITEKIVSSVATLVGSLIISKVETETLKSQLDSINELELRAREYEADGNPLLAKVIRDNAEAMSSGCPGHRTELLENGMHQSEMVESLPVKAPVKTIETEKRRRGRPRKTEPTVESDE